MKGSIFFVLLAAILWGTTGTAQALAPDTAHPIAYGAMRLAFGGSVLFLFVAFQKKLTWAKWSYSHLLLAAISMACYQPFFFSAVKLTGIAVGTVVAIGSAPIIAGIIEWAFQKKKPTKYWWSATGLAITGCIFLFLNDSTVTIQPYGIALALGAGLSFALYTLASKQLLETHPPDVVVAVVFTLSAVLLVPLLFFYDLSWLFQLNGIVSSLYIGIVATAIAYIFFVRGLHGIRASTAVTLSLAEPLTATLLGAFFVGEMLTGLTWIGVTFVFLAMVVLGKQPKLGTEK